MATATIQERIERNSIPEPNSGCWIWVGAVSRGNKKRDGYGLITVGHKSLRGTDRIDRAHRVSYRTYKGDIPEGMHVMHQCNNTLCVNPDHLTLGSHQDNMRHREESGRTGTQALRGSTNPGAKTTEAQVAEAKRLRRSTKLSYRQIAHRTGISYPTAVSIFNNRTWKHVPWPDVG